MNVICHPADGALDCRQPSRERCLIDTLQNLVLAGTCLVLFGGVDSTLHAAPVDAGFTYQGRLSDRGGLASGLYDLQFTLRDAASGGNVVGVSLTKAPVAVSNGLFTVTLDFGGAAFDGSARWLEIAVRTNGSVADYDLLSPAQPLMAAPYALRAASASTFTGTIADTQLSGNIARLNSNVVFTGAVEFNNPASRFNGAFTGNGAGVTNVSLATANSFGAFRWNSNFPGTFVLDSSPRVGRAPRSVAAADVNGDGYVDLISANLGDATLSVLTNNHSGGFVLAQSVWDRDFYPLSVTTADVNGDGNVDLISASRFFNVLWVWINDGTGHFFVARVPRVGNSPVSVTAADVNGDGQVDLISANRGDNTLTVLTNDGSGGFVFASCPPVESGPLSVAATDVNGDGQLDLISANADDNTLSVLINVDFGNFVPDFSLGVGNAPVSVTAADVNGDGAVDLITANASDSTLSVLINDGFGWFDLASSPVIGNTPVSVTAADVNGDGHVDLITANYNTNTLTVLTNNGSGGFVLATSPAVGSAPYSVTAADVNGDGQVDLISANYDDSTLTVLFNTPTFHMATFTGNFTGNGAGLTSLNATALTGAVPSASLTSVPASSLTGTVADARLSANVPLLNANQTFTGANTFTHQGNSFSGRFIGSGAGVSNVNLVTANSFGAVRWMTNFPGSFVTASSLTVEGQSYSVVAADVNGDGRADLICANELDSTLTVLTNDGSGGFERSSSPEVGVNPFSVTAAEVNGDGQVDLISANIGANTLTVLTNDGSGGFRLHASVELGFQPYSVVAVDVNGDHQVDLITADYFGNSVSVLMDDGFGEGQFVLESATTVGTHPLSVTAADVNGDGKVDLITANSDDNTLTVLTNNGTGSFEVASSLETGGFPIWATTADVNGDGWVDLISANTRDHTLTVLTNNGRGSFALASSPAVGSQPYSVVATDVNGDGKVDLITANSGDNTLTVLTNNGTGGFALASLANVGLGPTAVTAADVNGDGRVDLISANVGANALTVLFNTPTFSMPTFTGSFTGDGTGLTGLSGSNLTDGTITATKLAANLGVWTKAGTNIFYRGGNVGIGMDDPQSALHVTGNILAAGIIAGSSDRNLKENFTGVRPREVLDKVVALPVTRWNFKGDDTAVHIGPMAQDFHGAFALGTDDRHIATVDADGVALAAIQGLNQKLEEQVEAKDAEIEGLKKRLDALEKMLTRWINAQNGGAR